MLLYNEFQLQVEAVKINCPTISTEDFKDFVYESYAVEGECCQKHKPVACKVGEKVHQVINIIIYLVW